MRRVFKSVAVAALLLGLLSAGEVAALTTAEIATYSGTDRQKLLEEGARKEATVTLYTGMIVDQATRPLLNAFMKKYPFVKADYWRGDSRAIITKLMAETRTGNLAADVAESSGLSEPLVRAGVTEPFRSPELAVYDKKYLDPRHLYAPTRLSYFGMAYNTKLVPTGSEPKSYEALLDPKWKGKIAWRVDSDSGSALFIANLRLAWGDDKADAYLKRFAAQKIISFDGSARTLVNRVMEGEYPLAVNIFAHHPLISARDGAPVGAVTMDPVPSVSGTVLLLKGTKHPHAAMLLIDFMLSKDGQETLKHSDYFPSHPGVEPDDYLKPIVPQQAGHAENYLRPEALYDEGEKNQALYDKYFN
jgi:iron(III) transport system substrate-binding protein